MANKVYKSFFQEKVINWQIGLLTSDLVQDNVNCGDADTILCSNKSRLSTLPVLYVAVVISFSCFCRFYSIDPFSILFRNLSQHASIRPLSMRYDILCNANIIKPYAE